MDNSKLNALITDFMDDFKSALRDKLQSGESHLSIIDYIDNYHPPTITEEDVMKKKRIKNVIPFHDKCIAKRANGEQCSRRKKKDGDFCGTHSKACPHGTISLDTMTFNNIAGNKGVVKKQIEVWLEDINGIMCWINSEGAVYHPDDIRNNIENPRVISHYEKIVKEDSVIYKITDLSH